jgi:hypothetical protein
MEDSILELKIIEAVGLWGRKYSWACIGVHLFLETCCIGSRRLHLYDSQATEQSAVEIDIHSNDRKGLDTQMSSESRRLPLTT